jgi:hypothetical protein|nr:MAG TPA: hypothetical protein [Caudoviricetes sp.]DAX77121.1 MAG TPA: hypothetical protein [Caudoviricetes sp.]
MKFDFKQKIVLFYGNILRVNAGAVYLAADSDGEVFAYNIKPVPVEDKGIWRGVPGCHPMVVVTFDPNESWKDTLTYCGGEGQEWMLAFKTRIAVEYARLEAGDILKEKALCNVMEALPFGTLLNAEQWAGFRKHSGVDTVASEDFLVALAARVKSATKLFIGVEKSAYLEDNSLLVRNYYGGELVIPEWAKFIGMDSNGRVWVYEEQPEVDLNSDSGGVWTTCNRSRACDVGWRSENTANKEWHDSLREVQK